MSTPPGDEPRRGDGEAPQDEGWGAPPPPSPPPQGDEWGQPQQPWSQPEPQWAPPPAGPAAGVQQTNGMAIGALVASILGFFCWFPFFIGLVLGYSARSQIRASGGYQGGEGVATAAIVIGWIGVGLTVLGILFFVLLFAVFGTTMPGNF